MAVKVGTLKWTAILCTRTFDLRESTYMAFVYAWIVPLWADQLLPQLSMEQFDTFAIQCRHIEHMREGLWFRKNY